MVCTIATVGLFSVHACTDGSFNVSSRCHVGQAIAAGNAERLREFLEAGVEATSEYGAEGG